VAIGEHVARWTRASGHQSCRDTLRPCVDNIDDLRAGLDGDAAAAAIESLWTGNLVVARREIEALRLADPAAWRWQALEADLLRDEGQHDEAIERYQRLAADHRDTRHEPVLVQHLGKAQFAAGRYVDAAASFRCALELRLADSAPEALVASSKRALERASELAEGDSRPRGAG